MVLFLVYHPTGSLKWGGGDEAFLLNKKPVSTEK